MWDAFSDDPRCEEGLPCSATYYCSAPGHRGEHWHGSRGEWLPERPLTCYSDPRTASRHKEFYCPDPTHVLWNNSLGGHGHLSVGLLTGVVRGADFASQKPLDSHSGVRYSLTPTGL